MSERFSFNLVDEPWIPVLEDGATRQVSLQEALVHAHDFSELVGDLPTQVPALLRLLLAVLHRALGKPHSVNEWVALWKQPQLPAAPIEDYLAQHRDRFDLFDCARPFLQCPLDSREEPTTAAVLVPHLPAGNNVPLFYPTLDDDPPILAPAEAARWLLHTLAWDTGGIKTGRVGDPQVKQGKSYGNPVGPLGEIGVVMPFGETLRQTLLFNLLPPGSFGLDDFHADAPPWERDPLGPSWSERPPRGPADLYCWVSRRVTLVPERSGTNVVVRRVIVGGGDRIAEGTRAALEPHAAWSARAPKGSGPVNAQLRPVTHNPEREAWRGLGSLLAAGQSAGAKPPAVLRWLGVLVDRGVQLPAVVDVRLWGTVYGAKSAVVEELFWDALPLPVKALSERDPALAHFALACAGEAEAAGKSLGDFATEALRAAGADEKLARSRARIVQRQFFHPLDARFRRLLVQTGGGSVDLDRLQEAWRDGVREQAWACADDVVAGLTVTALAGRELNGRRVSVAEAEGRFRRRLGKAVPAGRAARVDVGDQGGEQA